MSDNASSRQHPEPVMTPPTKPIERLVPEKLDQNTPMGKHHTPTDGTK